MKANNFFTIIEEIKKADSLTVKERSWLLSFVEYLQSTKIELLKNITPKRISEIIQEPEKEAIIDIFYFLCGKKWHLLEPIYRYIDDYSNEPIEITEEELADIRERGYIALNNGNVLSKFNPTKLFITFTLSDLAIRLKREE